MSNYPAIVPNAVSFDLGQANISEVATFAGPVRFRHTPRINGHGLRLSYVGLNQQQVDQLREHYIANQGFHRTFFVPASIWGGLTVVSSNSEYRYQSQPQEEHTGLNYNVTINLRITDGVNLSLVLFCGGAAQPAVAPFQSFVLTGNAPFILNAGGDDPTLLLQGRGASQ
jgi:hypothetical protein